MPTYRISQEFPWQGPLTDRAVQLCRMFGLTVDRLSRRAPVHQCRLDVAPGDIVYITGPSGSGKTVLLKHLEEAMGPEQVVNLETIALPEDRTVIDCFETDIVTTLRTLGAVGLSDVFAMLNRPCWLSEGQKYRFRLARALAAGKPTVVADEFGSELDRISAATVAFNIHKYARRTGTTFILASSHDDILMDLAPDVLVSKEFAGGAEVIYKTVRSR